MMRQWLACWLMLLGAVVPFLGDGVAGRQAPRSTLAAHRIVLGDPEAWALVRGALPGRPAARLAGGTRPAQAARPAAPGEWGQPVEEHRLPELPRGARLSATPISCEPSCTGRNRVSRAPPAASLPLV